ncbi:MAG: hypothetical protein ACRBM6_20875 [Geminicoccales bacterium]
MQRLSDGRLDLAAIDDEDSRTTTTGSAILSNRLKLGNRTDLSSSLSYRVSEVSDLNRTDHDLAAGLGYAKRLTEHLFPTSTTASAGATSMTILLTSIET